MVIIAFRAGKTRTIIRVNPIQNRIGDDGHVVHIHTHEIKRLLQRRGVGRVDVHPAFEVNDFDRNRPVTDLIIVQRNSGQWAV